MTYRVEPKKLSLITVHEALTVFAKIEPGIAPRYRELFFALFAALVRARAANERLFSPMREFDV